VSPDDCGTVEEGDFVFIRNLSEEPPTSDNSPSTSATNAESPTELSSDELRQSSTQECNLAREPAAMDQLLPVSMMIKMEASQPFYHWMVYQADHMHNGFVEIEEGCYYHGDWGVFVDWSHSDNRELIYGNPEGMRLALSTMPQEIRYQPKEKHMLSEEELDSELKGIQTDTPDCTSRGIKLEINHGDGPEIAHVMNNLGFAVFKEGFIEHDEVPFSRMLWTAGKGEILEIKFHSTQAIATGPLPQLVWLQHQMRERYRTRYTRISDALWK